MAQHPNSLKNLIPKDFSKMSNFKELSAKGGRAKTEAKRVSSWLRENKRHGNLSDKGLGWICNMLDSPELSLAQITQFIYKHLVEDEKYTKKEAVAAATMLMAVHKAKHGDKAKKDTGNTVNIQPVTINIGINDGSKRKPRTEQEASESIIDIEG